MVMLISIGSELSDSKAGSARLSACIERLLARTQLSVLLHACTQRCVRSQLYRRLIGSCSSAFDICDDEANHAIVDSLRQSISQRAQKFCADLRYGLFNQPAIFVRDVA